MQRLINWFQKNMKWIAVALFVLYVLKSCQSCSKSNELAFQKQEYEAVIDSLDIELQYRDIQILNYQDSVNVLKNQVSNNNAMIESLNNDKKNYQKINESLAQKAKELK